MVQLYSFRGKSYVFGVDWNLQDTLKYNLTFLTDLIKELITFILNKILIVLQYFDIELILVHLFKIDLNIFALLEQNEYFQFICVGLYILINFIFTLSSLINTFFIFIVSEIWIILDLFTPWETKFFRPLELLIFFFICLKVYFFLQRFSFLNINAVIFFFLRFLNNKFMFKKGKNIEKIYSITFFNNFSYIYYIFLLPAAEYDLLFRFLNRIIFFYGLILVDKILLLIRIILNNFEYFIFNNIKSYFVLFINFFVVDPFLFLLNFKFIIFLISIAFLLKSIFVYHFLVFNKKNLPILNFFFFKSFLEKPQIILNTYLSYELRVLSIVYLFISIYTQINIIFMRLLEKVCIKSSNYFLRSLFYNLYPLYSKKKQISNKSLFNINFILSDNGLKIHLIKNVFIFENNCLVSNSNKQLNFLLVKKNINFFVFFFEKWFLNKKKQNIMLNHLSNRFILKNILSYQPLFLSESVNQFFLYKNICYFSKNYFFYFIRFSDFNKITYQFKKLYIKKQFWLVLPFLQNYYFVNNFFQEFCYFYLKPNFWDDWKIGIKFNSLIIKQSIVRKELSNITVLRKGFLNNTRTSYFQRDFLGTNFINVWNAQINFLLGNNYNNISLFYFYNFYIFLKTINKTKKYFNKNLNYIKIKKNKLFLNELYRLKSNDFFDVTNYLNFVLKKNVNFNFKAKFLDLIYLKFYINWLEKISLNSNFRIQQILIRQQRLFVKKKKVDFSIKQDNNLFNLMSTLYDLDFFSFLNEKKKQEIFKKTRNSLYKNRINFIKYEINSQGNFFLLYNNLIGMLYEYNIYNRMHFILNENFNILFFNKISGFKNYKLNLSIETLKRIAGARFFLLLLNRGHCSIYQKNSNIHEIGQIHLNFLTNSKYKLSSYDFYDMNFLHFFWGINNPLYYYSLNFYVSELLYLNLTFLEQNLDLNVLLNQEKITTFLHSKKEYANFFQIYLKNQKLDIIDSKKKNNLSLSLQKDVFKEQFFDKNFNLTVRGKRLLFDYYNFLSNTLDNRNINQNMSQSDFFLHILDSFTNENLYAEHKINLLKKNRKIHNKRFFLNLNTISFFRLSKTFVFILTFSTFLTPILLFFFI